MNAAGSPFLRILTICFAPESGFQHWKPCRLMPSKSQCCDHATPLQSLRLQVCADSRPAHDRSERCTSRRRRWNCLHDCERGRFFRESNSRADSKEQRAQPKISNTTRQPPQNLEQLAATAPTEKNPGASGKRPQQRRRALTCYFLILPSYFSLPKMSAYVIVEIDILDPAGYEEYKNLAGATVEKYGGKYIVRGGKTEVLEGDWQPKRIVVLQFESMRRAREWLNCEEYREPRKMRHRTAKTKMILVEGV